MTRPIPESFVHPSAEVSSGASVGRGVKIWNQVQVREGAVIGDRTILGKGVYVDAGVSIGVNCKVQNGSYIYQGVTLEDGVFIGPRVCFTNDLIPRAINERGDLKSAGEWTMGVTRVCHGASIGAGAVILPDITIGRFAMVGAGAVVTKDVPDHGLVVGVPAKLIGYVCSCGKTLRPARDGWRCSECASSFSNDYLREVALA
jgi:UDP-2-acetamido-3-amino-2,3-dideoxy-glucuronate N-acetyltransferase